MNIHKEETPLISSIINAWRHVVWCVMCGVCLPFWLPVRESGALLRCSVAKIRSDLSRMVFLKDLHGCNAAILLEVFTEKLFGWHDCTFVAAFFKVCDIRKDFFTRVIRLLILFIMYTFYSKNCSLLLSFFLRYSDRTGKQ